MTTVYGKSKVTRPSGSAGPNTSISLTGTQTVPGSTTATVVYDTVESSANLVAGVPTAPVAGLYWVNHSTSVISPGTSGTVKASLIGSVGGVLDDDPEPVYAGGFSGTLSGLKRVQLAALETLSVEIDNQSGATATLGGDPAGTFLQFWQ